MGAPFPSRQAFSKVTLTSPWKYGCLTSRPFGTKPWPGVTSYPWGRAWTTTGRAPTSCQPTWWSRTPGLKAVKDIRDHKDIFPQEGGKILLPQCLSAWACSEVNEAQLKAYGLDDIITLQDPGSQASLFASLEGAYKKGDPWLGYMWGPTKPDAELDLTRLEEPVCLTGQLPSDGCGYPTASIRIVVHPTLIPRAPDVIEFLRKWNFTAAIDVAANAYKADSGADFDGVATWFLQTQEAAWTQWVSAEVAQKVKDAL